MTEVKKTAEEIVDSLQSSGYAAHGERLFDGSEVIKAMHEYSQQVNAELLEAVEHLRKAFVISTGDKSPFAQHALKPVDEAIKRARGL